MNQLAPEQLCEIDEKVAKLIGAPVAPGTPRYTESLDAFDRDCKPWIEKRQLKVRFHAALSNIVANGSWFEVINASALQRCLVLLRCV